jgi:transposase, IS30 family
MSQLNMDEREILSQLHAANYSPAEIAARLGRHRSTIGRELRRNGLAEGGYSAAAANRKAATRRRERPWVGKMEREQLNAVVRLKLSQEWSPDQIAGRLKREHPEESEWHVAPETIYTWIQRDPHREHWESHLRRGRKRRKSPEVGRIPRRVEIDGRPEVINNRERLGDFEGDTIVSGGRKRSVLVTLVDRKSGYLLTGKLSNRTATKTREKIVDLLLPLPADQRHSITFDNGKEFSEHEALSRRLGVQAFFAHPYCSWERGSNENTNGLVRQYYPKGTDFAEVSHQDLADTTQRINDRPRKRHNYQTPSEVFFKQSSG